MNKAITGIFLLGLAIIQLGCGGKPPEAFNPASVQGTIDTSLPRPQQRAQQGVQLLLNAVQEGAADPGGLALLAPVDFREPFPKFFSGGKRLVRWDFNGPPKGSEVPVTLYFDGQTGGPADAATEVREDRVYQVGAAGQRFTITRK